MVVFIIVDFVVVTRDDGVVVIRLAARENNMSGRIPYRAVFPSKKCAFPR
jgi:hypothetical protein